MVATKVALGDGDGDRGGDGDGDSSKYWNQLDFSNAGFLAVSCLPVS